MLEWALLGVLLLVAGLVVVAYRMGENRRRSDGVRPVSSIGEALRRIAGSEGRVLVVFLQPKDEGIQEEIAKALRDPTYRGRVLHVVLGASLQGEEVCNSLFEKYAGETRPRDSVALLLDESGQRQHLAPIESPVNRWLGGWLADRLR